MTDRTSNQESKGERGAKAAQKSERLSWLAVGLFFFPNSLPLPLSLPMVCGCLCVRLFFFPVAFQIRIISLCVRRYFWWLFSWYFSSCTWISLRNCFCSNNCECGSCSSPSRHILPSKNVANKKSGYHFLFVLIYFEMLSTYAIHNTYANTKYVLYEYAAHCE